MLKWNIVAGIYFARQNLLRCKMLSRLICVEVLLVYFTDAGITLNRGRKETRRESKRRKRWYCDDKLRNPSNISEHRKRNKRVSNVAILYIYINCESQVVITKPPMQYVWNILYRISCSHCIHSCTSYNAFINNHAKQKSRYLNINMFKIKGI